MRAFALAVVLTAAGLASLHAGGGQNPQTTFRAATDLVQVDVSVLDNQRRPVRGLTAQDFTVLEDGQPRPVVAFTAVDLAERTAPSAAPWMYEVGRDVASNEIPQEGRLVVILMDRTIPDGFPTLNAQAIAKTAVNELGAGDMAAVVFTSGGGSFQGFTSDRDKLIAAIDATGAAGELSPAANELWSGLLDNLANQAFRGTSGLGALDFGTDCMCGACVLQGISRIADAVRDAGGRRRKTLLFIGRNLTIETVDPICIDPVKKAREQMFKSLDLASLTVHSLDPGGLETPFTAAPNPRGTRPLGAANLVRQGNISVLPDRTGGRTVLNTNAPAMRVPDIFAESDSYYLLGFQPRTFDGLTHNISVKVNRRGVDVRTRKGYIATPPAPPPIESPAPAAVALTSITGLLPVHTGVLLNAQVSPLPSMKTRTPVLAVTLHAEHDPSPTAPRALMPAPEQVEIVTAVFNAGGRGVGTLRQTLMVTPQLGNGGVVSYDVIQRLPARPGRYELRIGVTNQTRQQTGSVYTFVDIPDYLHETFVMGEVGVYASRMRAAAAEAMNDLLPAPATARRLFGRDETATAFVRFYQGFGGPPASIFLKAQVIDERNRKRYGQEGSIPSSSFSGGATADYMIDLPLQDLERGEYLLSIEAKAGSAERRRDVIFAVR